MDYNKLMSSCKLVDLTKTSDISDMVGENLHEWCKNEGISDEDCEKLLAKNEMNDCLVEIFNEEMRCLTVENINQKTLEKEKTYIQLQNMDKELSNYTTERDIQLMEQLNKTKFSEIIYLIILLTIAWGFGIYIMFNYLVVEK